MSHCTKKIFITCLLLIAVTFQRTGLSNDAQSRFAFSYTVDKEASSPLLANCPDKPELQRAVTRRLGYSPWDVNGPKEIRAIISSTGNIINAKVLISDPKGNSLGERNLRSKESCGEVAEAVALTIAIAISPLQLSDDGEPGVSFDTAKPQRVEGESQTAATESEQSNAESASRLDTETNDKSSVETEPLSPDPKEEETIPSKNTEAEKSGLEKDSEETKLATEVNSKRLTSQLQIFVSGLGSWGSVPTVTPGLDAGVGVKWRIPSITLAVRYDFPASKTVAPGSVNAYQIAGQLLPCLHYRALMGCAVVTTGALRGEGVGLEESKQVTLPSVWLGARLGVTLPIWSLFFIRLYADVQGAIIINALRETDSDVIFWKTSPVGVAWGLSIGAAFFDGNRQRNTIKR